MKEAIIAEIRQAYTYDLPSNNAQDNFGVPLAAPHDTPAQDTTANTNDTNHHNANAHGPTSDTNGTTTHGVTSNSQYQPPFNQDVLPNLPYNVRRDGIEHPTENHFGLITHETTTTTFMGHDIDIGNGNHPILTPQFQLRGQPSMKMESNNSLKAAITIRCPNVDTIFTFKVISITSLPALTSS